MSDIDEIAARHVPTDRWQDGVGWCDCSGRWPCDTALVLTALEHEREALRAERERANSFERAAIKLWDLLDNIDAAEDMAKGNSATFYHIAHEYHRKRFEVAETDGYSLRWKHEQEAQS